MSPRAESTLKTRGEGGPEGGVEEKVDGKGVCVEGWLEVIRGKIIRDGKECKEESRGAIIRVVYKQGPIRTENILTTELCPAQ